MQATIETTPTTVIVAPPPMTPSSPKCLRIAIEMIDVPSQARKFFDEEFISRLANVVREKGQTWPVKVRWDKDKGRWLLVAGEQRLRACKQAGLTEVMALDIGRDLTEAEQIEETLQENGLRTPLRPCEEAEALDRLRRLRNCTLGDLSRLVGFNTTHVSRRLALLGFSPAQRAQIDASDIPEAVASEIAKVTKEADRFMLFNRALQQGWTRERATSEVTAFIRRRKARSKPAQPLKRVSLRLGPRGATVAVGCPNDLTELNTQDIVDALEFALKEVRKALREQVPAGELAGHFQKLTVRGRKPAAAINELPASTR